MIIRREEAHSPLAFPPFSFIASIFQLFASFNASSMPKLVARGLLHETSFRATIFAKKIVGKNRSLGNLQLM